MLISFFTPDCSQSLLDVPSLNARPIKGDGNFWVRAPWDFRDVTLSGGTRASACWDALRNVQLSAVHSLLKCQGTDVVQLPVSHWDYSLRPRLARPLSLAPRRWSLAGKYVSGASLFSSHGAECMHNTHGRETQEAETPENGGCGQKVTQTCILNPKSCKGEGGCIPAFMECIFVQIMSLRNRRALNVLCLILCADPSHYVHEKFPSGLVKIYSRSAE